MISYGQNENTKKDGSGKISLDGEAGKDVGHDGDGVSGEADAGADLCEAVLRSVKQDCGGDDAHAELDEHERGLSEIEGCGHQIIPLGRPAVPHPHDGDDGVDDVEREEQKDGSRKAHRVFSLSTKLNGGPLNRRTPGTDQGLTSEIKFSCRGRRRI